MNSFREKLSAAGLSKESSIFIATTRRTGSVSHYKLACVSGIAGVIGEKLIPLDVLRGMLWNFLRKIAGFRSAISAYHGHIQSISLVKKIEAQS